MATEDVTNNSDSDLGRRIKVLVHEFATVSLARNAAGRVILTVTGPILESALAAARMGAKRSVDEKKASKSKKKAKRKAKKKAKRTRPKKSA